MRRANLRSKKHTGKHALVECPYRLRSSPKLAASPCELRNRDTNCGEAMRDCRVLIPTLVLLAAGSMAGAGRAQPALAEPGARAVPASAIAMKQSFAPVVKRAAPAVVNISSKRRVRAHAE